jgi:hypothetical protein
MMNLNKGDKLFGKKDKDEPVVKETFRKFDGTKL